MSRYPYSMNKRIVIVEDTMDLQAAMAEILQMEGYLVLCAGDGEEAQALLNESIPDLIITDLRMPKMDGYELIKSIRKNKDWQAMPILVFSAMPPGDSEARVLQLGANSYLKKPSTLEDLVGAVKTIIENE